MFVKHASQGVYFKKKNVPFKVCAGQLTMQNVDNLILVNISGDYKIISNILCLTYFK